VDEHASWVARDAAVVWHGFTQMAAYADNAPLIVERGEGRELIDVDGRRYLDAISSLWVTTLGHHVPELDQAVRDQLDLIAHSTMLGNGNRTTIELAEALTEVVPVDRPHFLFASDGAAAVEQALRIALQHWTNRGVAGRTGYLAFGNAYHGDTIGSLSVGDGGFGTTVFDPLRFPVLRAPADDAATAVELIHRHGRELAAVILEPLVQGAAGMMLNGPDFVRAVADACQANEVVLICDEVAMGFGRTGTMFALDQCGVQADIVCIGKGLTGGYLPMAATVVGAHVYESFLGEDLSELTLYHGHSYSGNALAAAVARRHLQLFSEWDVLSNVRARAAQLQERLTADVSLSVAVAEVRQRGLMVGVELAPTAQGLRWARKVSAACVRRGVLIRSLGDVVVLMPILTSTEEEIDRIVDVLAESIEEVCA